MNAFKDTTNASGFTYLGPIQNSNSYTGALVSGMGFDLPTLMLDAPGLGSNPPDPRMRRSKP
jgi:hypothetical protein